MSEPIKLVTKAAHEKQEILDFLDAARKHVESFEDRPGAWAVILGLNLGGHADVKFCGNAHELLALSARAVHAVNKKIDNDAEEKI